MYTLNKTPSQIFFQPCFGNKSIVVFTMGRYDPRISATHSYTIPHCGSHASSRDALKNMNHRSNVKIHFLSG